MKYVFTYDTIQSVTVEDGSLTSTLKRARKNSRYAAALDTLESALLASACAGITQEQFQEIGDTVMDAIGNNLE